ncbi:hypothetical protein WMY93_033921, partial [Mugilogobius chulae]
HNNYLQTKVAKCVGLMKRSSNLLDQNALLLLYHSFVMSYLNCAEVWGNCYKTHLLPLIRLQKKALRIGINKQSSWNLKNLFQDRDAHHKYKLRGDKKLYQPKIRTTLKSMCISVRGVAIWNGLPDELKYSSVNSRKDKSLRVMSQKFVMLFLVSRPRVVSLDVAAQILIGEDQGEALDKNKFKTKVRRLYDIANVLRSLKLIEKVHVTEERGRKPAFEWVGPEEFQQVKDEEVKTEKTKALSSRSSKENCAKNLFSNKRSFTRHPSLMKLAQSIQEDRRRVNSAPSSPNRDTTGFDEGGAYAVYVPPPSLRNVTRPQPTSLAVRSMTFDSPTATKRPGGDETEASPSKTRRSQQSFKDASPKLGEILQARLKSGHVSSRPSPRALHLDPEFLSRPASEHSTVDMFLEREEKSAESEGLTPIRAVPLTPGTIHAETLVPAGYLIPLSQPVIGFKDLQSPKDTPATPTYLYHTPQQMTPTNMHVTPTGVHVTPTGVHVTRASPLITNRTQSPSPAILNFTLQNLGLISGHNQSVTQTQIQAPVQATVQAQIQTPGRTPAGCRTPVLSPLSLTHRGGMVFIKPVSPLHLHSSGAGQQVALISLQQPQPVPSSSSSPGFFHTPVSMAPLSSASRATASGFAHGNRTMFVAQRKLDVGSEDT